MASNPPIKPKGRLTGNEVLSDIPQLFAFVMNAQAEIQKLPSHSERKVSDFLKAFGALLPDLEALCDTLEEQIASP